MKKRISSALVWGGILLSISALCGCQELEEKNTKIETIKEQVKEIEASLPKLEQTDKELKAYIENLEATADDLRKSITASDDKIAELEKELEKAVERANENAVAISKLRTDLETVSAEIAKCATDLNSRINDEIKALNETIDKLTVRVETLETEVKNLKTTISNIQTDIEKLNGKVDALTNRIQSISFVPDYSDGRATMSYTLSGGMIVPGSVTMRFEIQPASLAEKIADVWKDVLSLKAVYTMTRASAGEMIELPISDVTSSDGIISVTASGSGIDEAYFRKDLSLNVRLLISDGNTQKASDYINMIPWTTDVMHIPDANFKSYLIKKFDADGDGKISGIEALLVTGIDVSSYNSISTLSGIEYFVNLERLDCSSNLLTTLDVTHNTKLIELNISNNNIENIDLSCCESLASLNCAGNGFVSLDVSRNKELRVLDCSDNNLNEIDIRNCCLLDELDCSSNHLTTIDLSKNTKLTKLDYSNNSLTSLDLAKLDCCANLVSVNCANNGISEIDLHTLTQLQTLNCSRNPVKKLVLDNCVALQNLFLQDETKDAANDRGLYFGTYTQAATFDISAKNTPFNSFVFKDSPQLTSLALAGDFTMVNISDNTAIESIDLSSLTDIVVLYVVGCNLQFLDLTANINLEALNCSYNRLSFLDLSKNTKLTDLKCSDNNFTSLKLAELECCASLVYVNCANNDIAEIDLHTLTQLRTLNCAGNPVRKLVLDNCAALQDLLLQGETTNAINGTTLKFRAYTQATAFDLSIRNTPFTGFTFKDTPELTSLVFDGDFTSVDISGNTAVTSVDLSLLTGLTRLDARGCCLQSIDLTKNLALESLDCSGNLLPSLNIANNTALRTLKCSNNNITKINVAANTSLEDFDISDNGLSAINLCNNTALRKLNISGNKKVSLIDLRNNALLKELNVVGVSISELDLTGIEALNVLNVVDNPLLARIVCPSQGWLSNTDFRVGVQEVYCVTSGGDVVQGGCAVIDGKVWSGANVDGIYYFDDAQAVCPSGWRTPSKDELSSLSAHYSEMTTFSGMQGRWFSGNKAYSDSVSAIFLPVKNRSNSRGYYWSSTVSSNSEANYLFFSSSTVYVNDNSRSNSLSVRCVKDR